MNNLLYQLSESYNSDKTIRALIKLIPYGNLVDSTLSNFYTKEREKRLKAFYDELANCQIELSQDVIESDEFLHKYFITVRAAVETKRTEKIKYFARLLANCNSDLINHQMDYYDDFVKVLDDLSFQELYILQQLKLYIEQAKASSIRTRIYRKFRAHISQQLSISEDEAKSLFIRLNRTGCIHMQTNMEQLKEVNDNIETTDFFNKLASLVMIDM